MKVSILSRRFILKDSVKSWAEKKFSKLDRLFNENTEIKMTLDEDKSGVKVEVTIYSSGIIYRAQVVNHDIFVAIDKAESIIKRQIRKNKTRLEKKLKHGAVSQIITELQEPATKFQYEDDYDDNEEYEFEVVRTKKFDVKPMSTEEAILQMNLLGHHFFVFQDDTKDKLNVVYKRHDGGYGLIEQS